MIDAYPSYMRIVAQSKMGAPVIKFQELIPSTNQGPRVPAQACSYLFILTQKYGTF